jgi:hypothetical protein
MVGFGFVWACGALKLSVPAQMKTKSNKKHILFMSKPPVETPGRYRSL